MFRTSNPALRAEVFAPAQTWDNAAGGGTVAAARPTTMTLSGTVNKSLILLGICAVCAVVSWNLILANTALILPLWAGGALAGFALALVLYFRPQAAPVVAPLYAVAEGLFLGGASVFWASYAGHAQRGSSIVSSLGVDVVFQAAVLTFGVSAAMLGAYATRLIKPSNWMLGGIVAATGGVVFFSLAMVVFSFVFPHAFVGLWHGPFGLALAGVIVVIAAFNLVLDFALIENGVQNQAPRYMEWYAGFCLLVTLVWLYVSILRFLSLLRRN